MKRFITPVVGLALVGLVSTGACKKDEAADTGAAASKKEEKEVFGSLTLDDVETRVKATKEGKDKLFVFDNNSKDRYEQGHVPSAKWVDYKNVRVEDLPSDKEASLVFYCSNEF